MRNLGSVKSRIADLSNNNTGLPVKFEFQISISRATLGILILKKKCVVNRELLELVNSCELVKEIKKTLDATTNITHICHTYYIPGIVLH